jgi:hypothetical protein
MIGRREDHEFNSVGLAVLLVAAICCSAPLAHWIM